jgi:hypothetical protein
MGGVLLMYIFMFIIMCALFLAHLAGLLKFIDHLCTFLGTRKPSIFFTSPLELCFICFTPLTYSLLTGRHVTPFLFKNILIINILIILGLSAYLYSMLQKQLKNLILDILLNCILLIFMSLNLIYFIHFYLNADGYFTLYLLWTTGIPVILLCIMRVMQNNDFFLKTQDEFPVQNVSEMKTRDWHLLAVLSTFLILGIPILCVLFIVLM